jgi:hypothetical protein
MRTKWKYNESGGSFRSDEPVRRWTSPDWIQNAWVHVYVAEYTMESGERNWGRNWV